MVLTNGNAIQMVATFTIHALFYSPYLPLCTVKNTDFEYKTIMLFRKHFGIFNMGKDVSHFDVKAQ